VAAAMKAVTRIRRSASMGFSIDGRDSWGSGIIAAKVEAFLAPV
jgi:hypothetical protein